MIRVPCRKIVQQFKIFMKSLGEYGMTDLTSLSQLAFCTKNLSWCQTKRKLLFTSIEETYAYGQCFCCSSITHFSVKFSPTFTITQYILVFHREHHSCSSYHDGSSVSQNISTHLSCPVTQHINSHPIQVSRERMNVHSDFTSSQKLLNVA